MCDDKKTLCFLLRARSYTVLRLMMIHHEGAGRETYWTGFSFVTGLRERETLHTSTCMMCMCVHYSGTGHRRRRRQLRASFY